jgi:hypothetical protein
MPKIYEYFGLAFLLFYRDHTPIHVHVTTGETHSKFELIFLNGKLNKITKLKYNNYTALSVKDTKLATDFIKKYSLEIAEKWNKVVVLNTPVKVEKITKKV